MHRQKVFIAWNGENKALAERFGALLPQDEFHPIVGGEDKDSSMFVGQTVLHQMDQAELAVLIFEPRPEKDGGGVSHNVMFEWGYLLHKLPTGRRIQIYLLNMNEKDLPTDVSGCWAFRLEKPAAVGAEKEQVMDSLAQQICDQFLQKVREDYKEQDKLDYFDNWDESKQYIIHYDGSSRIAYKLMFGMQMSVYSGRSEILNRELEKIRSSIIGKADAQNRELVQVLNCVMAMLDVFIATKNISVPMNSSSYTRIRRRLTNMLREIQEPSTCCIRDPDLLAWCRIFLEDKLELCYEFAADTIGQDRKLELLQKAAAQCELMIRLNQEQVARRPGDEKYALLYRAFAHRNLFLISSRLLPLEPEKEQLHRENIKTHCALSLECRRDLYNHYLSSRQQSSVTMDYVTQEYLLGLVEQYEYESDPDEKLEMEDDIQQIYDEVKNANTIRGIIYSRIEAAISKVPDLKKTQ